MKSGFVIVFLAALCVGLWLLPSPKGIAAKEGETIRATVLETDDSAIQKHGLIDFGTQHLKVRLADGREIQAENELRAQLEFDEKFAVGDRVVVTLPAGIVRGRSRLGWIAALFFAFAVLLVAFGGWTGAKALFSFLVSCLVIWKGLIPLTLAGWPASWTAFAAVVLLTLVIMLLVAGWTRKCAAATLGASLGVLASLVLAHGFGRLIAVNGATMPFVQTLLYSGYESLELRDVFFGAVILASSGAVMDLAMDIAAGIEEVKRHNPALAFRELCLSGLRMGRAVVGTMTTTLLLAYSGGFLTLLMVFSAQGTSPLDFLESPLVTAEVVKTLVGSFGLVLVAPFTALVAAGIYTKGTRP